MKHLHNRRLWQLTLAAMLVPLMFVAYWPSPVDQPIQRQLADILNFVHDQGIPPWFNYKFIEASANVALFIPPGLVSTLAFPGKRWWQVGALGLFISGCMELGQFVFLHNRFASPLDLVTNTSGTVIGALLGVVVIKRLEARHLAAADLQKGFCEVER